MSVPVLASPYRLQINPAFFTANPGAVGQKIYARLPSAPATAAGPSDIWPGAALQGIRALPASVFQIAVSSDSASDIMTSGSGAWQVLVTYLDANYASQTALINLNGQTAVASGLNALRIQAAQIVAAGSGGANAGNVYVYDATATLTAGVPQTPAKIFAFVAIGYNTDSLGMFTVPAGYQAQILHVNTGVTSGTATVYTGRVRVGVALYSGAIGAGTLLPFQYAVLAGPGTNIPNDDLRTELPDILPPGSEIRFQGSTTAAGGEIILIAEILLIPYPAATSQGAE